MGCQLLVFNFVSYTVWPNSELGVRKVNIGEIKTRSSWIYKNYKFIKFSN